MVDQGRPTRDFVAYLKLELRRRRAINPRYSLRAFAAFLGVDFSHLSKILRRQRPLSPAILSESAERLGLNALEIEEYRRILARGRKRGASGRVGSKPPL